MKIQRLSFLEILDIKNIFNKKFILYKLCNFILVMFLFNNLNAQSSINVLKNSITISDTLIQFDTKLNVQKTATFKITNTFNRPISIKSVVTECGCAQPDYNTKPINVNETTEVKVTYLAPNIGLFNKKVTISFSHTNQILKVRIKGNVNNE